MKNLPVAVQIYSVRDDASKDFKGTMKKLKEIGYDGVELAGMYSFAPGEIKTILADTGLTAVSAHVPLEEFRKGVEATVKKYSEIGCKYVALPYLAEGMRPNSPGFGAVLDEMKNIGKVCADYGVAFSYHNHDFEFEKMEDGAYCLDYIYKNIPDTLLKVQPDICWIHVSGVDPAAYIRKYAGRCPTVHLKDYLGVKAKKMYELIGDEKKDETPDDAFRFKSVGSGKLNIPEALAAALDAGANWVIVEQDNSLTAPMLEEVKASRDYLKSLGW